MRSAKGALRDMAAFVKTKNKHWKAMIRKVGWPTQSKTFRTKRDAEDWARNTEDEMVRGVYLKRVSSSLIPLTDAFDRYFAAATA